MACRTGIEITDFIGENGLKEWLSDMDSNHDKVLQRDLCYHYTIGQMARQAGTIQFEFGERARLADQPSAPKCSPFD